MDTSELFRCYTEQAACTAYLLNVRGNECRGAALGLADWMAEEILIRSAAEK